MTCPICSKPSVYRNYKQLITCGDEECIGVLRSRNMRAWYGTADGKTYAGRRYERYVKRISAEVFRAVRDVAGEAAMIPRWQVLRIAARLRSTGYVRGYNACALRQRRGAAA